MPDIKRASPQERKVIKACAAEGFWYRSLPMGAGAGLAVYYAVRTGHLKPSIRFGAAPKVIMASFTAYWFGKFSYLLSGACQKKFLRDAPESETAYYIRKEKGLPQPWTATRDFASEDEEDNETDDYKLEIKINIPSLRSIIYPDSRHIVLSDKENEILSECGNRANFFFHFP